ncbi:MAG: hypothetical protein GY756_27975 [bacterium]|nr:hypothetical protein [bacterium]
MYKKLLPVVVMLLTTIFFISGCRKENSNKIVDKIVIIQGANQQALPNSEYKKELKLELLGPRIPGFFGGKGTREPVKGVKVEFIPIKGSDLMFTPKIAYSKVGGAVTVKIKTGSQIGDQYFKIEPENSNRSEIVRLISGVSIDGIAQEAYSGNYLPKPLKLKLVDKNGKPVQGADVFFHVSSSPEKKISAKCVPPKTVTDKDGIAKTKVKVGTETGVYNVVAEVNDPAKNINYRGIHIKELGINVLKLVIIVLAGLAIFIYGMKLMSDGLQLVAGQKLKSVLKFFTKNRFIAILAGTVVTAAIQSSSACTVMVVGFVNAGLLTLTQAIGIIFGANIGTTVTAQIISFKLEGLAFPAIIIGAVIMMCSKRTVLKGWGQTIFGFGLLFFGMGLMGSELKLISKFPSFVNFFNHFDCSPVNGSMPFLAILGAIGIGALMTVLIQSSSATIGIALALAMGGLINFYTAVPLILGDNIGTTITALLASLGANRPARQTAIAHMLFNVIGAIYMVILFFIPYPGTNIPIYLYFINAITPGDVFAVIPENIARHIAMAHTVFNVINVIIFIPFVAVIARICNYIIKIKDDQSIVIENLEPHLLETPVLAIRQVSSSLNYMLNESWYMIKTSINDVFISNKIEDKVISDLAERELKVDQMQEDITEYLVKLTQKRLTLVQAELVPHLMHCTNDTEKIADFSDLIIRLCKRMKSKDLKLSKEAVTEFSDLWKKIYTQAESVMNYLENAEETNINIAEKKARKIKSFTAKMEKAHIKRLEKGKCNVKTGVIYIEMLGISEQISSCLENISDRMPRIKRYYSGNRVIS